MADVIDTQALRTLRSVHTPDYPGPRYVKCSRADCDRIDAIPPQYRKLDGSDVVEMDAGEKATADAAAAEAAKQTKRATIKAALDGADPVTFGVIKAIVLELQSEFRALKQGNPLGSRDIEQLRARVKQRVDGGEVD